MSRIDIMFQAAKKDKQFLLELATATNDKDPVKNSDKTELTRVSFAACYYGYLVGKHGPSKWRDYVNHPEKHKL